MAPPPPEQPLSVWDVLDYEPESGGEEHKSRYNYKEEDAVDDDYNDDK